MPFQAQKLIVYHIVIDIRTVRRHTVERRCLLIHGYACKLTTIYSILYRVVPKKLRRCQLTRNL